MKYILLLILLSSIQVQLDAQSKTSKVAPKTSKVVPKTTIAVSKTSKIVPKTKNAVSATKKVVSKTTQTNSTNSTEISDKATPKISKKNVTKASRGIQWLSLEEAQEQMKLAPRKVYVDLFTDWCGWCKVMEAKTFSNKHVIEYINENYYAVHLNAETGDSLLFKGKKYGRIEESKTNSLAATLMNNKLTYPTSIFFDEDFLNPQPVPGYLDIPTIELILKYIATNKHKSVPFEKYKKEFKSNWEN